MCHDLPAAVLAGGHDRAEEVGVVVIGLAVPAQQRALFVGDTDGDAVQHVAQSRGDSLDTP